MSSSTPKYETYQRIVRDILESEIRRDCPGAQLSVFHNRKYRGKSSHEHQIDVSAEIKLSGMQILVLAECKLYSRKKVSNDQIQVLASRIEDIGAHKGLFVTNVGFQKGAKKIAKSKGIALFVKDDLDSASWRVVLPGLLALLLPRARAAEAGDSATRPYSEKTSVYKEALREANGKGYVVQVKKCFITSHNWRDAKRLLTDTERCIIEEIVANSNEKKQLSLMHLVLSDNRINEKLCSDIPMDSKEHLSPYEKIGIIGGYIGELNFEK